MKRIHLVLIPCLLVVIVLGVFVSPTLAHSKSISPATCGQWSVFKSPNLRHGLAYDDLFGTSAISPTDVWAVGYALQPGGNGNYTTYGVTEHWNGSAWSIIPDASPTNAQLNGVAAVATNDVWAVGMTGYVTSPKAFIENWNGTSWSASTTPHPKNSILNAVSASSSTDVWAVGSKGTATLIMHWNGTAWSVIAGPSIPNSGLYAVTALSPTDVWAVGSTNNGSENLPLIEHWDGNSWQVVSSPSVANGDLVGITAVSSQMIWAVGYVTNANTTQTLIESWNGTSWTVVPSPNPTGLQSQLLAVSAVSGNNIWAVGYSVSNNQNNDYTLIVHWDGTTWSAVSSPDPSPVNNALFGITQIPGTSQLWSVGEYYNNGGVDRTLTVYYC